MNILFDTNVILDIAAKREPHYTASSKVFMKINNTFEYIISSQLL